MGRRAWEGVAGRARTDELSGDGVFHELIDARFAVDLHLNERDPPTRLEDQVGLDDRVIEPHFHETCPRERPTHQGTDTIIDDLPRRQTEQQIQHLVEGRFLPLQALFPVIPRMCLTVALASDETRLPEVVFHDGVVMRGPWQGGRERHGAAPCEMWCCETLGAKGLGITFAV